MSCVYPRSPEEHAHEKHVANRTWGIVEEVKKERISKNCRNTDLRTVSTLVPERYQSTSLTNTLFKQLCSTEQLKTGEGRRVLTPFAFVSVLAGVLLAIEFVRRLMERVSMSSTSGALVLG